MNKVSIIVPVYNIEKYLAKCLDSLINQTLEDIEIICVNDGSTDNSAEILNEYAQKDCRIKIINQDNAGLSAARNTGINAANGEYIGYVDSDDWIDLNFYEKLYNAAKDTDADIVKLQELNALAASIIKKKYFLNLKNPQPPKIQMKNSDYVIFLTNRMYGIRFTNYQKLKNIIYTSG